MTVNIFCTGRQRGKHPDGKIIVKPTESLLFGETAKYISAQQCDRTAARTQLIMGLFEIPKQIGLTKKYHRLSH